MENLTADVNSSVTTNLGGNLTVESMSFGGLPSAVTTIFLIIGWVGVIGNSLVCIVIASTLTSGRSGTTNLLILNQAAVDSITSLVLILVYTLPYPTIPESGGWAEFLCRMWVPNSLLWMLFVVSTYNLCTMSIERYVAVAYPVMYTTKFGKRSACVMIFFSWVVAPLLHYYYPIAYDFNNGGQCQKRGDPKVVAAIGVLIFVWEFFVPFTIMAVVYIRIVQLLRRQQKRVRAANEGVSSNHRPPDIEGGRDKGNSQPAYRHEAANLGCRPHRAPAETIRRNVTITLLAVFIMYGICWMPNHLTFLQFGLGGYLDFSGAWYYFTLILAYMNMSINPFIYGVKYKVFRQGFKKLFCKGCRCIYAHRRNSATMIPQPTVNTTTASDRGNDVQNIPIT